MNTVDRIGERPSLSQLVAAVLHAFPNHAAYLRARFDDDDDPYLDRTEMVAERVMAICGENLSIYAIDYRWMCERFLEEEIHFARTGCYRLSSFEQARAEVYADPDYMARYVRGILLSQVLWAPHARAMDLFRTRFLPSLKPSARYLEIGPGHGLFLHWAASFSSIAAIEAWDISASSVAETRHALAALGTSRQVELKLCDLLSAPLPTAAFEVAVISEVLEHLEDPGRALAALRHALTSAGRLFVNVPINSPAPDHIFLLRSPDEATALVEAAGFTIESLDLLPLTGVTLERALRKGMSVSCIIVATARD